MSILFIGMVIHYILYNSFHNNVNHIGFIVYTGSMYYINDTLQIVNMKIDGPNDLHQFLMRNKLVGTCRNLKTWLRVWICYLTCALPDPAYKQNRLGIIDVDNII